MRMICFVVIAAVAMLAGCANSETFRVFNDTEETISNVTFHWQNAAGRATRTFGEIPPGKFVTFDIPTDPPEFMEKWGTSVDMAYVWKGDKYEYARFIRYIGSGDNSSEDIRIRGKTAISYLRFAFMGPGAGTETGIVRKSREKEREILQKHLERWQTADRVEIVKSWMEKVPKTDGSYPDWTWVKKQSAPVVLSNSDRQKLLDLLAVLEIPDRSEIANAADMFTIKLYAGEQPLGELTAPGNQGITGVPGIDTTLEFPKRIAGARTSPAREWRQLFQRLFPETDN